MRKSLLALGFIAAFAAPALAQNNPRITDEVAPYSDSYGVDTTTTQSISPSDVRDAVPSVDGQNSLQRGNQATTFGANGR